MLAYGLTSGLYAVAMLVAIARAVVDERAWPLAVPFGVTQAVLLIFVREGWDNLPGKTWEGLVPVSAVTRSYVRTAIRVIAGSFVLCVLAWVLILMNMSDTDTRLAAGAKLPGVGIALFILFFSIVYVACSALGGEAVKSARLSTWERMLGYVGRRIRKPDREDD